MHIPRATLLCAVALTSTFATAPVLAEREPAAQKPLEAPAPAPAPASEELHQQEQPQQLQQQQLRQEQLQLQQQQQQRQDAQKPLFASWLAKVASYLPDSLSRATTGDKDDDGDGDDDDGAVLVDGDVATSDAASVAAAAASAVVRMKKVDLPRLTLDNWKTVLRPSSTAATGPGEPEEWWILVTGGNKTCHGDCEPAETAFNETASIFSASRGTPHQAILNCENQTVLCYSWAASAPSIWHLLIPRAQNTSIDVRAVPVNASTVTAAGLVQMHLEKSWRDVDLYEGAFHPFDGWLAQWNLAVPVGQAYALFARLPTWSIMIAVSFLSRVVMRRGSQGVRQRRPAAPDAGRPARPQ